MAVIRLQLVVDPTLHPELHRLLHAIDDDVARAERMRQLAATGLLWENLRLQAADAGGASLPVPPLDEMPSDRPLAPLERQPEPVADGAPDTVFLRELASAMEALPVLTETIDPAQLHAEPPAAPAAHLRLTGTRSRLLRMKDKGLFRNE